MTLAGLPTAPVPQQSRRHPVDAYLDRLTSAASKGTMRGALNTLARIMTGDPDAKAHEQPWWLMRYEHTSALRARLLERGWSPATVNKHLSALRQVLEECWRLDLMGTDDYHRSVDVPNVKGSRVPAGRALTASEVEALLYVCQDGTSKGVRDTAMVAVLATTGLRRAELVGVDLAHWFAADRALRVLGKGDKERLVHAPPDTLPYLSAWLRVRGTRPGPLFCPLVKGGRVVARRLSAQSVAKMLGERGMAARIPHATPHDLRRTFAGDLLDVGADLPVVQRIMGHASPVTTAGYDRRGRRAERAATDRLTLPPPRDQPRDQLPEETPA